MLDQTEANKLLDAVSGTAAYTAPTTPIKCRLMTANGSATAAGTQAAGGSYVSQTITSTSSASGANASNVAATYTGMPAATIVGIENWDSNGTPRRLELGTLTASKTTNAGDTLTIPSGSLTRALA